VPSTPLISALLPPDWGYETIEAASASPPNKKKKERAGSMQLFRHIVLSAALHTHMHKKKIAVSIIWMFKLGLPPA
jgi:hypothetical protein